MEEKTEKGQQIGQLPKRDVLTGNEQFPFQEGRENGSTTPNTLKSFIGSGLADDEDLVSVDKGESLSVLKFADRAFSPDRFSGKGYKILRRNIVGGKNILTQEMINQPDTIYEIRYDFDLDGAEISIPEGCILKFNGGAFFKCVEYQRECRKQILNAGMVWRVQ
jgi:hypothetical protein